MNLTFMLSLSSCKFALYISRLLCRYSYFLKKNVTAQYNHNLGSSRGKKFWPTPGKSAMGTIRFTQRKHIVNMNDQCNKNLKYIPLSVYCLGKMEE